MFCKLHAAIKSSTGVLHTPEGSQSEDSLLALKAPQCVFQWPLKSWQPVASQQQLFPKQMHHPAKQTTAEGAGLCTPSIFSRMVQSASAYTSPATVLQTDVSAWLQLLEQHQKFGAWNCGWWQKSTSAIVSSSWPNCPQESVCNSYKNYTKC